MIIREFAIKNFRSLKNIKIPKLNPITLLHGDNDVGKSNILTALEIIFKSKAHTSIIALASGKKEERHVLGFWEGDIQDFRDNFYRDTDEPINFRVVVRFEPNELPEKIAKKEAVSKICRGKGNPDDLNINGEIRRTGQDTAYQKLNKVSLNNNVIYEEDAQSNHIYVSSLDDLSESEKYTLFEAILSLLNDFFTLVSSRRYLTIEKDQKGIQCELDPSTFKNWLFNLEMNRETYSEFEELRIMFGNPPFDFGEISFARERDELEILVKRNELRLPIGRLGTGVQQILYLLANIVHNKGKVIGIEEMEINLSERSQNYLLKLLDDLINSDKTTIRQVIMSTHSYDYGKKGQVLRWWVHHDGNETIIKRWDNDAEAFLMEMRIGRLTGRLSDKEIKDIFLKTCSNANIKDLIGRVFSSEEIKKMMRNKG